MRRVRQIIIMIITMVGLVLGSFQPAAALPGGIGYGVGYFTGINGTLTFGNVLKGCSGSDALSSSMTSKAIFIRNIKNFLNNGEEYGCTIPASDYDVYGTVRNKRGAQFIIQTMRGERSLPTAADVADWEARVNNPAITISWESYSYAYNSGYMGQTTPTSGNDDGFYNNTGTRVSLVFRNNGTIVFAIKSDCGNPNGGVGLPPPPVSNDWALSGSTTVSDATVEPGQSITFSHYVKNNGPDTASGASYDTDVSGGIGTAKPTTAMADIASGATINVYNDAVTVPANASIGTQYCQNVGYTPQSSSNAARATGASVCATVIRTWRAVGTLTVSAATANPGQTVVFTSIIKNNGPHDTDPAKAGIDWTTYTTNSTGGNPTNPVSGTPSDYTSGQQKTVRTENFSIPSAALPGTMYCRVLGWTPQSSTDATEGRTGPVCVTVVYNYELVPVANSSASAVPTDTAVTFSYSVTKTGTNTNLTSLATRRIVIPATAVLPADWSLVHDNASCATYTAMAAGVVCQDIATSDPRALIASDRSRKFTGASTVLTANDSETIPPLTPVGTRVCRVLTLDSYDETPAPHNRDSAMACVTVSKAPYMALVGADGSAGGQSIQPCTGQAGFTGAAGATYGSFGEYGLFATGPIKDFSSTALLGGRTLTFANSGVTMPPATEPLGYYQSAHCIGDYVLLYASRANATGVTTAWGGSLAATSTDYRLSNASLTVPASTIGIGKRYLIYAPNSTVQITGDISYTTSGPTLKTFADAPSLIIVAKIITIDANVTRVDGMLFAKQYLNTCTEAGANPNNNKPAIVNDGICKQSLIVNGAVVSGGLVLPRTRGGLVAGEPAEIFRMRPEVFLQPYSYASSSVEPSLVTDYEQELPPRN